MYIVNLKLFAVAVMSAMDINKEYEDENKTLDKKQIEAEEKEVMLKAEEANINAAELKTDEGPVKTALSGDLTEQGREVKPKFIPIGAIKMPGFFTKNSDKDKSKVSLLSVYILYANVCSVNILKIRTVYPKLNYHVSIT